MPRYVSPYRSPPATSPLTPYLTASNAIRLGRTLARGARSWYSSTSPPRMRGRLMSRSTSSNRSTSSVPGIYGGSATRPISGQYRFRKRNRRVRRRARKYYRTFRKALNSTSGVANQKMMRNNTVTSSCSATTQSFVVCHLDSYNSTTSPAGSETDVDDIYTMTQSMSNTVYADITANSKFQSKYGLLDYTLRNYGATKVECDMYHIVYNDNVEYTTFNALITGQSARQTSTTSTTTDKIEITTRGATLFDLPMLFKNTHLKILSKTKLFLAPGDSYNGQLKRKRPVTFTQNELASDNNYFARKGITQTLLFVFKTVTGEVDSAAMTLGATRSYSWYVEGQTQPGTANL